MSKHTPGPWLTAIQECHTGDIATVYHTTDGWVSIWSENWAITGMDREEQSANARLIAAAPDLLEALKLMVEQFTKGNAPSTVKDSETRIKAHAAIAKATGTA